MEDQSNKIEVKKSWIISLVAVTLVLLVISAALLTLLWLQDDNSQSLRQNKDSLVRKPRNLLDPVAVVIEEAVKELKTDDVCVIKDENDEEAAVRSVCITKHCIETAASIISSMDKSVDPCQDFYKFACGGFIAKNPVPKHELLVSAHTINSKMYFYFLQRILEETDYTKEPNIVFRMQEAYHVCINATYQPKEETEGFKRFLQETLDGWPNDDDSESLEELMGKLIRNGHSIPYIKVGASSDKDDAKKLIVKIGYNYESLLPVKTVKVDHQSVCDIDNVDNLLERVARAIGHNETCFRHDFIIDNLNMLQDLVGLFRTEETKKTTIGELMNVTRSEKFDWLKFMNTVYDGIHTFTENDEILVMDSESFYKEVAGLAKIKGIFRQYVRDVIVQNSIKHGGPEIEKYWFQMVSNGTVTQAPSSRERTCMKWINENFAFVLTRLVVKQYLNPRLKGEATKLVDLILKAYEETIKNSTWVDEVTKERAIQKARSMTKQIAYPEYVLNDEELEKRFESFPRVYSTHIENVMALKRKRKEDVLKLSLREINLLSDWLSHPLKINAAYSLAFNNVIMQLGMLIHPYFDVDRIAAVNYGFAGTIVGHEIGHGFDTAGRLYDERGREIQWWTRTTEQKFLKKAQCFIDQYSNYCPEELFSDNICVDGKQTVAENLADVSGLKAAYEAYRSYVIEFGEEKRLPGLQEFTPEQIFFITFANAWCENIPPFKWLQRYEKDEHSPSHYRVNGPLSNSEDFAHVFNCPPGPMNRDKDRCTLW